MTETYEFKENHNHRKIKPKIDSSAQYVYTFRKMEFEWDNDKRIEVLNKRDVDFVYAVRIFVNPILEWQDNRIDYGEVRMIALGHFEFEFFVVTYTMRGNARRIITAWKAGKDERRKYYACYPR